MGDNKGLGEGEKGGRGKGSREGGPIRCLPLLLKNCHARKGAREGRKGARISSHLVCRITSISVWRVVGVEAVACVAGAVFV